MYGMEYTQNRIDFPCLGSIVNKCNKATKIFFITKRGKNEFKRRLRRRRMKPKGCKIVCVHSILC